MDNSDVFGSSTAPLTWHDFLERMRHPSAAEFVKAIKSFIVSFLNNAPDAERDSASVQEFLNNMEAAFRAHSLWAGSSEEELESAGEGLEKYVMTKLFTRVYASVPEDVKADDQLYEKMALVQQFIRPENLDIKPKFQNEASWLLAQKELLKINMYKAPRDKLLCILYCCKVINNLLVNVSVVSNEDHPGADEFLPVLIYVTIKANPPQLHSNLSYIQRFRRQTRLVSEAAYFFTNMLSVESFVMNLDAKALSMDEIEYETNIESARALLSSLSESSDNSYGQADRSFRHIPKGEPLEFKASSNSMKNQLSATQPQLEVQSSESGSRNEESLGKDQVSLDKFLSISDLENKGANMVLKEDDMSQIFHDFPYLYARTGDLTVSDVEDLLNNYKQLVLKYVCLAKGLGVTAPSPPNITKESEKTNYLKDVSSLVNDLGEESVSGLENMEPKLPEEENLQTQGDRGDDNSLR